MTKTRKKSSIIKGFLSLMLVSLVLVMASFTSFAVRQKELAEDGTYKAKDIGVGSGIIFAQSYEIDVEVTVKDGKIANIKGFIPKDLSKRKRGRVSQALGAIKKALIGKKATRYCIDNNFKVNNKWDYHDEAEALKEGASKALRKAPVATPKAEIPKNVERTYNGKEQEVTQNNKGYSLSHQFRAKDVGTYTVKAKLENGYKWKDGTAVDKIFTFTIKPVKLTAKYVDESIKNGGGSTR